jgi:hypothetical protein
VEKARDKLAQLMEKGQALREKKEWILEVEQADVTSKIEDTQKWLEEKMNEQSQLTMTDEPTFTSKQLDNKVKSAEKLYKKISGKKKPKEPKKPKVSNLNMDDIKMETINLDGGENINFNSDNIKMENVNFDNIKMENVNFGEGMNADDFIKVEDSFENN